MRVFSTSLKGAALNWYTQLPAESIDNFDTLVIRFIAQYATSRPHHVTSAALASLRQSDDEPLRAFIERFAATSIKIRNLNLEVALHAMLMALKPGPFVDSLCQESPCDMDELRARAAGYIQMEEHSAFRDQVRGKGPAKTEQGHRDKIKVNNDSQFKKSTRENKGGRYDFYTPLNAPRVHILEEASNNNLLALPPPGHTPTSANKSKHCRYHRNHGDTTEECRTLRDRIEELIQAGHLGQYVQRQQGHRGGYGGRGRGRGCGSGARTDQPSGSQQNASGAVQAEINHETGSAPLRGIINTIAGGFAGGGTSSSTRKRHLRNINCVHSTTSASHQSSPPISFSDDDYAGVSPNQDDPMVIVVEIANWEVQKTLIDQGSLADVLYWPTFLKLDVPQSLMQPHTEPLVGFAGERVHTRGYIDLLTTFGVPPDKENHGPFPGKDGKIITVKANQKTARQCYAESLKISLSSKQSKRDSPTIAP
ncbi:uncharacterized protein LOC109818426 [Cajanus cajan]|uniref:uncharacterized protein LOC109818426 n=1 Tax=Cajanus cajan TaxID=3821 RepID=UPI00098D802B|nr:uncharacterized protein LOC109818426 [Cajanus cajan]